MFGGFVSSVIGAGVDATNYSHTENFQLRVHTKASPVVMPSFIECLCSYCTLIVEVRGVALIKLHSTPTRERGTTV